MSYEAIQFDKIKVEDHEPIFEAAVKKMQHNIDAIVNSTEPATFANTIEAYEKSNQELSDWGHLFFNLHMVQRTDTTQKLAEEFSLQLTRISNDVLLNKQLFHRIQQVYNKKNTLNLNPEQNRLLEKIYDSFRQNGALLDEQGKKRLRELSEKKSALSVKFEDNIVNSAKQFLFVTDNKKDVAGLPQQALEAARELAEQKQKTGWAFSLQHPSFDPVMKYAQARHVREKMHRAFRSRAFQDDFDNQSNIQQLVRLRNEMAQLLGHRSHADLMLENRMAKNSKTVHKFLDDLVKKVLPAARKEFEKLKNLAAEDGVTDFRPWDMAYYVEKLKQKELNFSSEELRPYFELDNVIEGVFAHANKLYGLNFKPADLPVYNKKDVRAYEVHNAQGQFMALLYADFFPRDEKRSGAWKTYYKGQKNKYHGRPHVKIVMNFTRPTKSTPALLSLYEVETLFHEFGHALHQMLSCCEYESLSGTNVSWDFVELPSQIMENWVHQREGLDLFARHYKTGEPIPDALVEKIKQQEKFLSALAFLRQLRLSTLDLAWHGEDVLQRLEKLQADLPEGSTLVDAFEREVCAPFKLDDYDEKGSNTSCSFSHIFAGGYSAGYYSYKWAEVLDADAFELFQEKGVFNPEVARSFYENILSRGDTEDPAVLYKKFRGRDATSDALLRRAGLL